MPVCPAGGWPRTASRAPRRARYPGGVTFPVVGMVGGGQLARMTHEAGIPLGLKFKLLSDTPQDSAA
ncbi:5-(carboxyamino)imidazole ribonucleotide synthase, partial [Streptomyces sp. SID8455]|nr:5-(carboxyamino)imidazole ribonucleotide synthase [Streptomyces sp. SID8455]